MAGTAFGVTNVLRSAGSGQRAAFTDNSYWEELGTSTPCAQGTLDPAADYLVLNDYVCSSVNVDMGTVVFGGRSLTLGSETQTGRFRLYSYRNADLVFNEPGLFLKRGTFYVEGSANNLHRLSGVMTFLPDVNWFTIVPDYTNMTFQVDAVVHGDAASTAYINCPADKAPFFVNLANENSDFAGKLVLNTNVGLMHGRPTTTLALSSAPVGSVEVRADTLLRACSADGTVTIGSLTFASDGQYEIKSAFTVSGGVATSSSAVLVVTDCLVLPASGTVKVRIHSDFKFAASGDDRSHVLVMKAPANSIDLAKLEFVPDQGDFLTACTPVVETVDGMDFLYLDGDPVVVQLSPDRGSTSHDGGSTSLTNAANWSDGQLPHAGAHYLVTKIGSKAGSLRTEVNAAEEYVFPGESLTIDSGCDFIAFVNSFTATKLRLMRNSNVFVGQWIGNVHLRGGEIEIPDGDAWFSANDGHSLYVDAPLTGGGTARIAGFGATSAPRGNVRLTSDSPSFSGRIVLTSRWTTSNIQSAFSDQNQYLYVSSAAALGGPLDAFDPQAFRIEKFGCFKPQGTIDFADTTRGIHLGNTAQIVVQPAQTVTFRAQRTFHGETFITGGGCLALGGSVRFGPPEAIVDTPSANSNLLTFVAGDLKALSAGCVDGLVVTFSNATSKVIVPADTTDAALLAGGIRNVKTDTPFVFAGDRLNIELGLVGSEPIRDLARTVGLLTVSRAAADALRGKISVTVPNTVFAQRMIVTPVETADDVAGTVTFAVDCRVRGTVLIYR